MTRGTLVLVVGPSGVGKDTVIAAVREALDGDPTVVFPRREITRPAEAGGEDHLPIEAAVFRARRAAGAYALAWEAHGLGYGVPAAIGNDLATGRTVMVNVSRGVLDKARRRFSPTRVISLVVPSGVLRERLTTRGREGPDDIDRRVARAEAFDVSGVDVTTIVNDGPLATAVSRVIEAIGRHPRHEVVTESSHDRP